jgi:hypothetical protein
MGNIKLMLSCQESQIESITKKAKEYFENELKIEKFIKLINTSDENNIF